MNDDFLDGIEEDEAWGDVMPQADSYPADDPVQADREIISRPPSLPANNSSPWPAALAFDVALEQWPSELIDALDRAGFCVVPKAGEGMEIET